MTTGLMWFTRELLSWGKQVFKNWWVWLGVLPTVLGLFTAYVPAQYHPWWISNLVKAGPNWQPTLVLVAALALLSAFLVHLETARRLAAYEYQAPEYEFEVQETRTSSSGGHITVGCVLSIRGTNPFEGTLEHITVSSKTRLRGLGPWEIENMPYGPNELTLPLKPIPDHICDLWLNATADIDEVLEPGMRDEWENASLLLELMIRYCTQPVGPVQKVLQVDIRVDLSKQFDDALSGRKKNGT